jgi:hypothetical protein
MKRLLLSSIAVVTGLFILEPCFISAESFTEGVRVSPETLTLKPVNMFGNLSVRPKGRS